MSSATESRSNNFDSIRLILAVLVILSHSYPIGLGSNDAEPLSRLTHGQVTFGNLGVWSFFAISGFLITQSWLRTSSPLRYLKKRIARIYPGFIVMSLICALFVIPYAADPATFRPISLQVYLVDTLRLADLRTPPVFMHNILPGIVNGSLWSVAAEFWCYIGVLLLGLSRLLQRRYFIMAVFVIAIAAHLFLAITGLSPGGGLLGRIVGYPPIWTIILPYFLAGMLFHLFGGRRLLRTPFVIAAAIAIVISNFVPYGLIVTLPICGSYLLMWLAHLPALHPLHLGRYGDFSYGTYLYAFPIQQLIVMHMGGHTQPWKLFLIAAPATLIAGALSWFLVEQRFLTKGSLLKHEGSAKPGANAGQDEKPIAPPEPRALAVNLAPETGKESLAPLNL